MSSRSFTAIALLLGCLLLSGAGVLPPQKLFVPWKVLNPGDDPLRMPLVLYWIPASRDEIRHSDLLTSRALTLFSSQCVGMQLIRPDDDSMIDQLGVTGRPPIALLLDGDGHEVARVENQHGFLALSAVERMVRETLRAREDAIDKQLDEAQRKVEANDRDAAAALYLGVWAGRCLFPRQGREAQRALRRLGIDAEQSARK
jgi:hypothetical protein